MTARAGLVACVLLAACGRLGFTSRIADTDAAADAPADDAPRPADAPAASAAIAYVGPVLQRHPGAGASDSVSVQAAAAGDAFAIQVSCSDPSTAPTGVTATIPGWTLSTEGALTGSLQTQLWSQTYVAIAPSTAPAMFEVTWSGSTCGVGKAELADEFRAIPASASFAFDAHAETQGTGDCTAAVTTAHANDAIWASCFSSTSLLAVGSGFTKGADNGGGDWTEYALTADPAETVEAVTFSNMAVPFSLSVVTIHAGG